MNPQSSIEALFPRLKASGRYSVESPIDQDYNCIAYAAGDTERWWQPVAPFPGGFYWPAEAPREMTQAAYVAAFETLGYRECTSGEHEELFERVAIFVDDTGPTHAARQLPDGRWVSKLGQGWDIVHDDVDGVGGDRYGEVSVFLRRPVS
jgi:hypothetical protein